VKADFMTAFNQLFTDINLPNQLKYGSKLIGRWMKDIGNGTFEVFTIWEYDNIDDYNNIETQIRNDKPHLQQIKDWYDMNGGKEYVFKEKILEVKNEEIISTV